LPSPQVTFLLPGFLQAFLHCFSHDLDIVSDIGGVIAREFMDFNSSFNQTLPTSKPKI